MKLSKKLIISAAVLLIAAVLSGFIYQSRTERYENWQEAPGVVTGVEFYRNSGKYHTSSHRIFYYYTVNGAEYDDSDIFSGSSSNFKAGDTTTVFYNPENPTESAFTKPGPGLNVTVPFFFALPVILRILGTRRIDPISPQEDEKKKQK